MSCAWKKIAGIHVEGARLLRRWLDDNGLRAQGNHGFFPSSWPFTDTDLDTFKKHREIANILGLAHMGTGADPTSSSYKADWDVAADKWHALGTIARRAGLKLYTHNHYAAYGFLLDGGPLDAQGRPTRSSGIRKLEHFLSITDPQLIWLEMDVFWAHVAQYKFHTYTPHDGSTQPQHDRPEQLTADTGGGPCRAITRPSAPAGPLSGRPLSGPWRQPYTADPQYFGGS